MHLAIGVEHGPKGSEGPLQLTLSSFWWHHRLFGPAVLTALTQFHTIRSIAKFNGLTGTSRYVNNAGATCSHPTPSLIAFFILYNAAHRLPQRPQCSDVIPLPHSTHLASLSPFLIQVLASQTYVSLLLPLVSISFHYCPVQNVRYINIFLTQCLTLRRLHSSRRQTISR